MAINLYIRMHKIKHISLLYKHCKHVDTQYQSVVHKQKLLIYKEENLVI